MSYYEQKILLISPIVSSHRNFDKFFLKCFLDIGNVTYVAPIGYLEDCKADVRINIPNRILRYKTNLGARLSGIRVINYILRYTDVRSYDTIVFLSYESISFFLGWPRYVKVYLFEHNNVSNSIGSRIKMFFYRNIPSANVSLALQAHVAEFIKTNCLRTAIVIPHPPMLRTIDELDRQPDGTGPLAEHRVKFIFSPSGSTSQSVQDNLKNFVSKQSGSYYAVCKGERDESGEAFEVRRFFDNFEARMQECDIVFIGARLDYRVSGVAFDALTFGKPIAILDCLFARELEGEYPGLVRRIDAVDEIEALVWDMAEVNKEQLRFLSSHSIVSVSSLLAGLISEPGRTFI